MASDIETRPSAAEEDPQRPARRRVLLVEDNADEREALRIILELMQQEVQTADQGHEAVKRARDWQPDVALIDIGLPDIDGYEVARQIRALPHGGGIQLIALTGYGQASDRRRAHEAGFDAHAVKPLDPRDLTDLLRGGPPGHSLH
jgi:CheY-like chemotaxis protein